QRLPSDYMADHFLTLPGRQAIEANKAHLRATDPRRRELGAKSNDRQHPHGGHPIDKQVQCLARGGVTPVDVLKNHQHGLSCCQALGLRYERVKRSSLPLLGREIEWRVAVAHWYRHQIGEQRSGFTEVICRLGEKRFELVKAFLGSILAPKACRPS